MLPSRACLALMLTSSFVAASSAGLAAPVVTMPPQHRGLLERHCFACHNAETQEGTVRLDDLPLEIVDVKSAERWQKVLDVLNAGEMPPAKEPQPEPLQKADFLAALADAMVAARRSLADQHGTIQMRRLNQREYKNTLRSLLGADVDVSQLPLDTDTGGFDTVGANLFMSANQVEQYESLAREALEEAFGLEINAAFAKIQRTEAEHTLPLVVRDYSKRLDEKARGTRWVEAVKAAMAQPENAAVVAELMAQEKNNEAKVRRSWQKIVGAPAPELFGFVTRENNADQANRAFGNTYGLTYTERYLAQPLLDTGLYLTVRTGFEFDTCAPHVIQPHGWPPGDYVLRVRAAVTGNAPPARRFIEFGFRRNEGPVVSTHEVTGTLDAPCVIEIPFTLTRKHADRNQNTIFIREKGTADTYEQSRDRFAEGVKQNGVGPEFAIWLDWFEIERKPRDPADTPPGIRALAGLPLEDKLPAPKNEAVRQALARFATEAFRGQRPSDDYVAGLLGVYEQARAAGTRHATALKDVLAVVLTSPMFLYHAEPAPGDARRELTGIELANRLSYFLWGAPPDQQLRDLADSGDLFQPSVLATQTERMLDDPRARDLVTAFTSQWLSLARLDFFQFNKKLYPHFDNAAKLAVRNEVFETVADLLRNNGSLRTLLAGDSVVVNAQLAEYYGIPDVHGDAFRRVALPPGSPRGGLLGMAAVHAMGSNGEHTSPVERGAWVLRKVLHDPPPPAPANVPAITRLSGKVLTTRERVLAHQELPQCASCHRKIDPIGFAMENFDAVGRWRTEDTYEAKDEMGKPIPNGRKTWTIDPSGGFHGGPAFADFAGMRDLVATKADGFARGFTSALIEYGLGRPCGFSDDDLVAEVLSRTKSKNYPIREFIHALVASRAFHTK